LIIDGCDVVGAELYFFKRALPHVTLRMKVE
jgi:hypothetical protein